MAITLRFDPLRLSDKAQDLRLQVRHWLNDQIRAGLFDPDVPEAVFGENKDFARAVARQGWIGMAWPKAYGGQERTFLERYVVSEEMLVARAPTGCYFIADRQSGPMLIRYASESLKARILPRIISGEVMFCIGMSEANSGSDLFAARAKASRSGSTWRLNGAKLWTTGAQNADYMIGLFRTSPPTPENHRHGLTSFLIDMHAEGVTARPIRQMTGEADFCEVVFDDVVLPEDHLIGEVDGAWKQATSELAFERSGPERFLETYGALQAFVQLAQGTKDNRIREGVGYLVAQLHGLRRMAVSVAGMLDAGEDPITEASMVKDLGTIWEQALPGQLRRLSALMDGNPDETMAFRVRLDAYLRMAPKLTIQGGTTEILRGIVARSLGLR
ncbi:acyl-CoA dehydrogenase family protein [Azospirillum endophyticum]